MNNAWYKKNGFYTPGQIAEKNKRAALKNILYMKTHCAHCGSANFKEINIFVSCIHERICFECNVRDFKNPGGHGSEFLDYPKTFYKKLLQNYLKGD